MELVMELQNQSRQLRFQPNKTNKTNKTNKPKIDTKQKAELNRIAYAEVRRWRW